MDRIAAIIPVHNRKTTTLNCLQNLHQIEVADFSLEVIVIDDGSIDGTAEAIRANFPDDVVLKGDGNLWWARGVNMGLEYALVNDFDYIYMVNDDVNFHKNTLISLYEVSKIKDAVCSSLFVNPETKKIVSSGYKISGFFRKMRVLHRGELFSRMHTVELQVDAISSMSTLIPVHIVKKVGMFNYARFPHHYSDIDYFIKVKEEGHELVVVQKSIVFTHGSGSNFHQLIMSSNLITILKSFFDINYANNLTVLFNSSIAHSSFLKGILIFGNRLVPYVVWLAARIFLPKILLQQILQSSKRI